MSAIFKYSKDIIPHALFLIEDYYVDYCGLDDFDKHKFVCTLCSYCTRRLIYLCTGDFSTAGRVYLDILHVLKTLENETNILFEIQYSYADGGHVYCYAKLSANIYQIEASFKDYSQQEKLVTIDEVKNDLLEIMKDPLVESRKMNSFKIPHRAKLLRHFNRAKKVSLKDQIEPIKNIMLEYWNYEY